MKPSIWFPLLAAAWLALGLGARLVFPHSAQVSLDLAMFWLFSLPITGGITFIGAMVCYKAYSTLQTAQARLWVWVGSAAFHVVLVTALLVRMAAL
jgi:hypothetical protein